ncbi:unnamed protein product [Moneuplotes crassus]|uniref:Uncharacterized protein n=1 Tax=Euplotes crassus TaxID=5936 RepID=A0AAD1XB83_EUPCR|nr:unnamed protein product [Moneuplotes crassus]
MEFSWLIFVPKMLSFFIIWIKLSPILLASALSRIHLSFPIFWDTKTSSWFLPILSISFLLIFLVSSSSSSTSATSMRCLFRVFFIMESFLMPEMAFFSLFSFRKLSLVFMMSIFSMVMASIALFVVIASSLICPPSFMPILCIFMSGFWVFLLFHAAFLVHVFPSVSSSWLEVSIALVFVIFLPHFVSSSVKFVGEVFVLFISVFPAPELSSAIKVFLVFFSIRLVFLFFLRVFGCVLIGRFINRVCSEVYQHFNFFHANSFVVFLNSQILDTVL